MKKFTAVAIALLCMNSACYALNSEQERRIEEKKRDALKQTVPAQASNTETASNINAPQKPMPVPQPAEPLYLIALGQKKITYGYDLAKIVVLLEGKDEDLLDLDSQIRYLKDQGLLPKNSKFDSQNPLRRGLTAYVFLKMLKIRGGIALHVLGANERLAIKELSFLEIISPGHVQDLITGQELVQIMDNVARYKVKQANL